MVHAQNDIGENTNFQAKGTNCLECHINFTCEEFLLEHLYRYHIKQPKVVLTRHSPSPIKLTIKGSKGAGFRIVQPHSPTLPTTNEECEYAEALKQTVISNSSEEIDILNLNVENDNIENNIFDNAGLVANVDLNTIEGEQVCSQSIENIDKNTCNANSLRLNAIGGDQDCSQSDAFNMDEIIQERIPGGEPTPPPDAADVPKIRVKTGLMQENPSIMEEIKTPGSLQTDDSLTSLFKNNDRAKDLGFTTSDPDFLSPQELAMPTSNLSTSCLMNNSLASIKNLPMQELANQVSRLQNAPNGMHQQNVLINIQHFQPPTQPVPPGYSLMYPPQPPVQNAPATAYSHSGSSNRYPYTPSSAMYYQEHPRPPPAYPTQHPSQMQQRPNAVQLGPTQRPSGVPGCMQYTPQRPPHHQNQQQCHSGPRTGLPYIQQPTRPALGPSPQRHRTSVARPRMPLLQQTLQEPALTQKTNSTMPAKRSTGPNREVEKAKKIRLDTLVPDKNDDADCEVVAVTQKSKNLPQIQSIQGNVGDPNVVHLSDSITLTTLPTTSPKPKESRVEAKEVADVLAARGITVTTASRSKDSSVSQNAESNPISINLNSSVCIIPQRKQSESASTVDLTDESDVCKEPEPAPSHKAATMNPPTAPPPPKRCSPAVFECHMCQSKFPSSAQLVKHRKSYHRTNIGPEFGIPLIDLRIPGITQRLTNFGIFHYIPLPNTNASGMFALPVLSADTQKTGNTQELATSMLTLGPIKPINPPRPLVKRGKPLGVSQKNYSSS